MAVARRLPPLPAPSPLPPLPGPPPATPTITQKFLGGFGLGPAAVPTGISSFFVDTAELEKVEAARAIEEKETAAAAAAAARLERKRAHALQEGTAYPLGPPTSSRGHPSAPQQHEANAGGGGSISTLFAPVAAGQRRPVAKSAGSSTGPAVAPQRWVGRWRALGVVLCVMDVLVALYGWLDYRYCVPVPAALPCEAGLYWCTDELWCVGAAGSGSESTSSSWLGGDTAAAASSSGCCVPQHGGCAQVLEASRGNGSGSWSLNGSNLSNLSNLSALDSGSGSWDTALLSVAGATSPPPVTATTSPRASWSGHGPLCWLEWPSLRLPVSGGGGNSTADPTLNGSWSTASTAHVEEVVEGEALSPGKLARDAWTRLRSYTASLLSSADGSSLAQQRVWSQDMAVRGSGSALLLLVVAKAAVLLVLRLSLDGCTRLQEPSARASRRQEIKLRTGSDGTVWPSTSSGRRYQLDPELTRHQYRFEIHEENLSEDLRALLKLRKDSRRAGAAASSSSSSTAGGGPPSARDGGAAGGSDGGLSSGMAGDGSAGVPFQPSFTFQATWQLRSPSKPPQKPGSGGNTDGGSQKAQRRRPGPVSPAVTEAAAVASAAAAAEEQAKGANKISGKRRGDAALASVRESILEPSRRFTQGVVGQSTHFLSCRSLPQLQTQLHRRLKLPASWPASRLRIAVAIPDDGSFTEAAAVGSGSDRILPLGKRGLADLAPAPASHDLAISLGLPYDTSRAHHRRECYHYILAFGGLVAVVFGAAAAATAAAALMLPTQSLSKAMRVWCHLTVWGTSLQLLCFGTWLWRLAALGSHPLDSTRPRPHRRCAALARAGDRVELETQIRQSRTVAAQEAAAKGVPPTLARCPRYRCSRTAMTIDAMEAPRPGWWARLCGDRGALFYGALLTELVLALLLWTSVSYCTLDSSSSSSSSSASVSSAEEDRGLLCWLTPPRLVDGLNASVVGADLRAELRAGDSGDSLPQDSYDVRYSHLDLAIIGLARASLLVLVLLTFTCLLPEREPKHHRPKASVVDKSLGREKQDRLSRARRRVARDMGECATAARRCCAACACAHLWLWAALFCGLCLVLSAIKLTLHHGHRQPGQPSLPVHAVLAVGVGAAHLLVILALRTAHHRAGLAVRNAGALRRIAPADHSNGGRIVAVGGRDALREKLLSLLDDSSAGEEEHQEAARRVQRWLNALLVPPSRKKKQQGSGSPLSTQRAPRAGAKLSVTTQQAQKQQGARSGGGGSSMHDDAATTPRGPGQYGAAKALVLGPKLLTWLLKQVPTGPEQEPVREVLREAAAVQRRATHDARERQLMRDLGAQVERDGLATLNGTDDGVDSLGGASRAMVGRPPLLPAGSQRRFFSRCCCCCCCCGRSGAASGGRAGPGFGALRLQVKSLEMLWSKYLSFTLSADKPGSATWGAAENTVLAQLATDPSLSWRERADRLAQMVQGAPHRSASTIRQRWAQLQQIAWRSGWRCVLNDKYRVVGWQHDSSEMWSWEYPVRAV